MAGGERRAARGGRREAGGERRAARGELLLLPNRMQYTLQYIVSRVWLYIYFYGKIIIHITGHANSSMYFYFPILKQIHIRMLPYKIYLRTQHVG